MPEDLRELISSLAKERVEQEKDKERYEELEREVALSELSQRMEEAREKYLATKKQVAFLEILVRKYAEDIYVLTGEKAPEVGIQIKVYKSYDYDPIEARLWSLEHAHGLLELDAKAFEKVAPEMEGAPIKIIQEPRVTIARDLSAYL